MIKKKCKDLWKATNGYIAENPDMPEHELVRLKQVQNALLIAWRDRDYSKLWLVAMTLSSGRHRNSDIDIKGL